MSPEQLTDSLFDAAALDSLADAASDALGRTITADHMRKVLVDTIAWSIHEGREPLSDVRSILSAVGD